MRNELPVIGAWSSLGGVAQLTDDSLPAAIAAFRSPAFIVRDGPTGRVGVGVGGRIRQPHGKGQHERLRLSLPGRLAGPLSGMARRPRLSRSARPALSLRRRRHGAWHRVGGARHRNGPRRHAGFFRRRRAQPGARRTSPGHTDRGAWGDAACAAAVGLQPDPLAPGTGVGEPHRCPPPALQCAPRRGLGLHVLDAGRRALCLLRRHAATRRGRFSAPTTSSPKSHGPKSPTTSCRRRRRPCSMRWFRPAT